MNIADAALYGEPVNRAEAEQRLKLVTHWRLPTQVELDAFATHRRLSDLADFLIAVADVGEEAWLLMERVCAGFPDPPRFCFFAYRSDGRTVCEADLDRPSPLWSLPDGVPYPSLPEIAN